MRVGGVSGADARLPSRGTGPRATGRSRKINYAIFFFIFIFASAGWGERGDELLSLVQSEALEAHVIALQENVRQFPYPLAYRTRSAHHRAATDNAARYIMNQFRRAPRLEVGEQVVGGIRNVVAVLPSARLESAPTGERDASLESAPTEERDTSLESAPTGERDASLESAPTGERNASLESAPTGERNASAANRDKKPTGERVFILCAHYDTQASRDAGWNPLASSAPGANKNGTGIAALLEIAYLLSQYEYEHELRFIALGGEELGFLGSRNYVKEARLESSTIAAVFNLDMLGFNWKNELVEVITNKDSAWMSRALTIANTWFDIGLKIRRTQDEFVDISSHKPFWDAGYNAVTLIENSTPWRDSQNYDANPFYRTARDTADKVNFELVRKVTQLVLVTVDSLLTDMFQPTRRGPRVTVEIARLESGQGETARLESAPTGNGEAARLESGQGETARLESAPTGRGESVPTGVLVTQSPVHLLGTFEADFPIDIVVHPSQVTAEIDRETRTYSAMVPVAPGENVLRVTARYPLGATSVEQRVFLEQPFVWEEVAVFPNPARDDELTEFRVQANIAMSAMEVSVYDAHGNLIKRIEGVADRLDRRVWRTWWNQRTSYGLAVSAGVYVCYISVVAKGERYGYVEKLGILR